MNYSSSFALVIQRSCPAFVGALFIFAGIPKIFEPEPAARVIRLVGIADPASGYLLQALGPWEVAIGSMLFLRPFSGLVLASAATTLVVFTGALVRLHILDDQAECNCFSNALASMLGSTPAAGMIRNAILMSLLVLQATWMYRRYHVPYRGRKGDIADGHAHPNPSGEGAQVDP